MGAVVLLAWGIVAILGARVAPYDPTETLELARRPPSAAFWFGTDLLGRDVFSRVLVGSQISLQLGFSHDVDIKPPAGVAFAVPKQTEIKISGSDKQAVGQVAAVIRKLRPPEPYKGKGVRYAGEKVRRKEGKKK